MAAARPRGLSSLPSRRRPPFEGKVFRNASAAQSPRGPTVRKGPIGDSSASLT